MLQKNGNKAKKKEKSKKKKKLRKTKTTPYHIKLFDAQTKCNSAIFSFCLTLCL